VFLNTYEIDNTSISGWVYAFIGLHDKAVISRRTLGLPTFPSILLRGVLGLEVESPVQSLSIPSMKSRIWMVGKERQV
jgi:hypothetical protein